MAWLKIHQTIRDHHKIMDAADLLQKSDAQITGCLVLLWLWAIDNAPDGDLSGISDAIIARAAKWNGKKTAFVEALIKVGLLDQTPEGLKIHDWEDQAGNLIDKRKKDAERKATERAIKKADGTLKLSAGCPADVRRTSAPRVEKSRVEKSRIKNSSPIGDEQEKAAEKIPIEQIRILWNDTAVSYSKANGVNGNRRILLVARWKEHPDLNWWKEYFARIESSAFLKGKNDRGWKATFDWVLDAGNMDKILEGKYDDSQHVSDMASYDLGLVEQMLKTGE